MQTVCISARPVAWALLPIPCRDFRRHGTGAMKVESVLMRGMFAMAALAVMCGIVVISLH